MKRALALALALAAPAAAYAAPKPAASALAALRARPPEQDVIYFLLPDRFENGDPANDRGGLTGDRLKTGFDPADKGFYHGGDLKGVIRRLDYIQGLGANAIWLTPIFANKPVQGAPGHESAGYHGYWITDFTRVDPHLGSDADFKALVDAAHARGMKVYMDIVVNHTADVIQYREAKPGEAAPYRSVADYPFRRRGGVAGVPINAGFAGMADGALANWARLTDPTFAYTPYVPAGEEHAKHPDWLNDPIFYHDRGDTDWKGESAQLGDFVGLDDLATENPRVVSGMISIFGSWIDRFGIDGFRIDTLKHVDAAFWRQFVPAMQARARARGIPHFHLFGEVANEGDSAELARWTKDAAIPAVLDFGFMRAAVEAASGHEGTERLGRWLADDTLFPAGAPGRMPTFLGNHDAGRFAFLMRSRNPELKEAEMLPRLVLGHALLLGLRGIPTIYAGDEQGFAGLGNDQAARQDMFATRTPSYAEERHIGGRKGGDGDAFDPAHPLYRAIAALTAVRKTTPALQSGRTVLRFASDKPGLFAVSRFDPGSGREVVLAYNTSPVPIDVNVAVETASVRFAALMGDCPATAAAPGTLRLHLPPLGTAFCAAR